MRESGSRPLPRVGVRKPLGVMVMLVISYCEWPASSGRLDAVTLLTDHLMQVNAGTEMGHSELKPCPKEHPKKMKKKKTNGVKQITFPSLILCQKQLETDPMLDSVLWENAVEVSAGSQRKTN